MAKKWKKRRSGRPRIQGVAREANGRVSRSQGEMRSYRAAIMARVSKFGVTEKQATDARSGSVVGRMALQGVLSPDQYNAAMKYIQTRHAYLRAISAKTDFKEPLPEVEGEGDYEEFCRRARIRYGQMQDAITDLCVELRSPAPAAALEVFIGRDVYLPELEGDLKLVLNRLARLFFGTANRLDKPMSETTSL